ncbi:NAD(P)-binding protein [Bimuria novae-zelandiae CBS 107.79]|uniref:NAD(P)-binding protein n=1 Tax=Bimuria novae-zelandiae CBS 107.79 TaxID=1447943 RepID=A0A6A5VA36_9PLEO|nr:NAD(P)-binding protein [Bimuria novae-zelandiae CBS 107.79]
MAPTHIALARATGNLGQPILSSLLAAHHTVTVLIRPGSNASSLPAYPNLTIAEVDFSSVSSLTRALAGAEVVIAALATSTIGRQNALIDAAVQTGVLRFIPAAFGMDPCNANCNALPVCVPKAAVQDYLSAKSRESEGRFTWTAISKGWRATLYNGGEVRCSATLLADVVRAVLGVIERRDETRNRVVYVHSAEKDGREWETSVKGTDELLKEIWADVEEGNVDGANLGSCIVGCLDEEYGCDYTGREANELLGVKMMTEDELRALVHSLV